MLGLWGFWHLTKWWLSLSLLISTCWNLPEWWEYHKKTKALLRMCRNHKSEVGELVDFRNFSWLHDMFIDLPMLWGCSRTGRSWRWCSSNDQGILWPGLCHARENQKRLDTFLLWSAKQPSWQQDNSLWALTDCFYQGEMVTKYLTFFRAAIEKSLPALLRCRWYCHFFFVVTVIAMVLELWWVPAWLLDIICIIVIWLVAWLDFQWSCSDWEANLGAAAARD